MRGTFADLPEGALVPVGGKTMGIGYVGGDGNDVMLITGQTRLKLYLRLVAR